MKQVLDGLRVLEIGHFVAAPFCTRLLADLGADVIKIEPPRGDPVRQWGVQSGGSSLWWSMHGRNKRSVAIDLKAVGAREIILELVAHCDVVVRSEERRAGKECVSTCRSRWSPYHSKIKDGETYTTIRVEGEVCLHGETANGLA